MSSTEIIKRFKLLNAGNLDDWYGPYESVTAANAAVPVAIRYGKTVGIITADGIVNYTWKKGTGDTDLKPIFDQLVDKVDIVNNLALGGTNKILSAEQGKVLNAKTGEFDFTFQAANLLTTTYNYNSGADFTLAPSAKTPIQNANSDMLNVIFKHNASDYTFLDTGLTIADSPYYQSFKLNFKPTIISGTPSIGLVIGDVNSKDWLCLLYSSTGAISNVRTDVGSVGFISVIRTSASEYAYAVGDELTVEYIPSMGVVRTSKAGVYAPDVNVPLKTGKLYIGARGTNTTTINLDLVKQITPDGFGKNNSDRITTLDKLSTSNFKALPIKPYTFQAFNISNIIGNSSSALSTTYGISEDGLDINYAPSGTSTAFYRGLGLDNSKPVYQLIAKYKVLSLGSNPILGVAFGVFGVNLYAFGYRQDGSISFNINGIFTNPRPATPSLAYVVGDVIGLDISVNKTTGIVSIKTMLNDVLSSVVWTINPTDFTNVYVYLRSPSRIYFSALINQLSLSTGSNSVNNNYYVNSALGLDSNSGSSSAPYKTISKAISSALGNQKTKIIVASGIYREVLNLSSLTFEDVEIIAQSPEVVQVFGSDQISGWTKTTGRVNVYEATFAGTILNQSRAGSLIYEHGNPSRPILLSERDALQKGLIYRLPFTEIKPVAGVLLCDSMPGSYYYESVSNRIYLHASGSSNPNTNGFSYENISKSGVLSPSWSAIRKANLTLKSIQFLYSTGVRFAAFNIMNRYSCTALASSGSGAFIDDSSYTFAYKDESGFCDGDGTNGHYSSVTDFTLQDQREGIMTGRYIDSWCHDNFDDGLSFHERADITVQGGLFEYNGDGGIRQSNDAVFRVYNAKARRNGWDSSSGTRGSGFDMVNPASANRIPGSLAIYNSVSENNRQGIAVITGEGTLNAHQCITRNNSEAEYRAETGVINAYNCCAKNVDVSKLKVTPGNIGVINVISITSLPE